MNLIPTPKIAPKGPKSAKKKTPIVAALKTKMRLYFHTINHAIQVFLKVSFLGFVEAPFMCICLFCNNRLRKICAGWYIFFRLNSLITRFCT